jgi:TorA maturation chaperone TorD
MEFAPVSFFSPLAAEDQARADFYALLARLYSAPPDAALLAAIAGADELPTDEPNAAGAGLAHAWHDLIAASAAIDAEAAIDEYQRLFVGVGRSEVSLHASTYGKAGEGNALLAVRVALAELGLARQSGVNLYEDHLATVCETMRLLIAGASDDGSRYPLPRQLDFFDRHIAPWAHVCCGAICDSPIANYYRRVAQLTHVFLAIERDSFAID